ncbi:hypothetical protein [Nostoc sp. CCY0012]|uniref:hypothetical protein n=1 Tax=Nostoc sp. CCY0012 TaxID=1056123 RepID=UPI0039C68819
MPLCHDTEQWFADILYGSGSIASHEDERIDRGWIISISRTVRMLLDECRQFCTFCDRQLPLHWQNLSISRSGDRNFMGQCLARHVGSLTDRTPFMLAL